METIQNPGPPPTWNAPSPCSSNSLPLRSLLKEHRSISRKTPKCQVSQHHRPLTYDHPGDAPLHGLVFNFRQGRDLSIANTEREQGKRFLRHDVKRSPHVKILDWSWMTLFDEVFETFYLPQESGDRKFRLNEKYVIREFVKNFVKKRSIGNVVERSSFYVKYSRNADQRNRYMVKMLVKFCTFYIRQRRFGEKLEVFLKIRGGERCFWRTEGYICSRFPRRIFVGEKFHSKIGGLVCQARSWEQRER